MTGALFSQERKKDMETTERSGFGALVLECQPEQVAKQQAAVVKRPAKAPEFEATCSGPDFTVRRRTAKTSRLLVILVSQEQYYVKDETTGSIEPLGISSLERALDGLGSRIELDCPWLDHVPYGKAEREAFLREIWEPGFAIVAKSSLATFDGADWNWPKTVNGARRVCGWYESVAGVCKQSMPLAKRLAMEIPDCHDVARNIDELAFVERSYGLDSADAFMAAYVAYVREKADMGLRCEGSYNSLYLIDELLSLKVGQETVAFDVARLCDYLFRQSLAEGKESLVDWMNLWRDALTFQVGLYGKITDKYPRHLATAHDVLSLQTKVRKAEVDANLWRMAEERMALFDWEPTGSRYVMTHPKTPDDLAVEGSYLSHCVGGYSQKVASGKSMVFFCREADKRDKPYVTVEVRVSDLLLLQAKRRFNKEPEPEAAEFVRRWCAEFGINGSKILGGPRRAVRVA